MVSNIQRGYRHPDSVSFRAVPSSRWSPRIIRPQTGRPVIRFLRHGLILLLQMFQRLKVRSGMSFFLAFSFLVLSSCLCSEYDPCLRLLSGWQGRKPPFREPSLPFDKPFLPLRPLNTFQNLVLVLRQGRLFRFFWIYLCVFLFPGTLIALPCPET